MGCHVEESNSGQLGASSEPVLEAETAVLTAAVEMAQLGDGTDADRGAFCLATGHTAAVAGAADDGNGGAAVTAAGDAAMV